MRMRRTHVIASPSVMMYAEHRTKVVLSVGLVMMSGGPRAEDRGGDGRKRSAGPPGWAVGDRGLGRVGRL